MWCKIHSHAHAVFKCIKFSIFFIWTKYSVRPPSFTICNTAYAKHQEQAFIASNKLDVDDFQKTHKHTVYILENMNLKMS
jgi:hypothetical protein